MSDIQTRIANALHWDYAIPRNALTVEVEDGWVTLLGNVDRPYQKSCAEADVLGIPGVIGVKNEIVVCSGTKAEEQSMLA